MFHFTGRQGELIRYIHHQWFVFVSNQTIRGVKKKVKALFNCVFVCVLVYLCVVGGWDSVPVQWKHGEAKWQHHGQMDSVFYTVPHPVLQGWDGRWDRPKLTPCSWVNPGFSRLQRLFTSYWGTTPWQLNARAGYVGDNRLKCIKAPPTDQSIL